MILTELDVDIGVGRHSACSLVLYMDCIQKCADDSSFAHSNLGICCQLPVFPNFICQFGEESGCFFYTFVQFHFKRKVVCGCGAYVGDVGESQAGGV